MWTWRIKILGFRVWDIEQKKIFLTEKDFERDRLDLSPSYFMDGGFSVESFSESISHDDGKRFIPMQSTGQKDKDGSLIFESDILHYQSYGYDHYHLVKDVVYFLSHLFGFHIMIMTPCEIPEQINEMMATGIIRCKVVGNKFSSPELLEKC